MIDACGNWGTYHDIPQGEEGIAGITVSQEQTYILARRILEDPYPTGDDAGYITVNLTKEQTKADKRNLAKIQQAYQVCQNYTAIEEEGLDVLSQLVETIVDLYPATASNATKNNIILLTALECIDTSDFNLFVQVFLQ